MHLLFVYGTLRHPPLLNGLLGRAVPTRRATLAGHRAAPLRGRSYPGLVVEPGASTDGSVIEVDAEGLAILDRFEGGEYTRTAVRVQTDTGPLETETYLLTGPSRTLVEPGPWSFDTFVAEAAADWVGRSSPGRHHPRS